MNAARPDQVLEVPRRVARADVRREDVHVVRPLHHLGAECEAIHWAEVRRDDRDAVAVDGEELELAEGGLPRRRGLEGWEEEQERLLIGRASERVREREVPPDVLELLGGARGDLGERARRDEGGVLLLDQERGRCGTEGQDRTTLVRGGFDAVPE